MKTRVLSNLEEFVGQFPSLIDCLDELEGSSEMRRGRISNARVYTCLCHSVRQEKNIQPSYLHTLHLAPRKKILLEQTLHVDNFIRLLHLRREKIELSRSRSIETETQTHNERDVSDRWLVRANSEAMTNEYELVLNLMGHSMTQHRR